MRGSIKKRYEGSWSLILDLGQQFDPTTGKTKRRQKWITVRGTKRDAERKLNDVLRDLQHKEFVEPSKLTVAVWLRRWLDLAVKPPKARLATFVRYKGIVEQYLIPSALGSMTMQTVTASAIERYYTDSAFKAATLALHHAILQRAFQKAVRDRLVSRNVAADVEGKPRADRDRGREARVHCWTADEARAFLATARAEGTQAAAFYALALDSGMRKGELCGLAWADVDLEAGKVSVVRQLLDRGRSERTATKDDIRPLTFGPTKTGRTRTIDIDGGTAELLAKHRRAQAELKMANRTAYQDHGLVFAKEWAHVRGHQDSLGQPLQMNNLGQREYARLLKAAGVRRIKFHGLRHTCATLLLGAGEPVHVVSERLGHASATMTLDVYGHVVGNMQRRAAATVGGLLYGHS